LARQRSSSSGEEEIDKDREVKGKVDIKATNSREEKERNSQKAKEASRSR
jgi:hypothetical protein